MGSGASSKHNTQTSDTDMVSHRGQTRSGHDQVRSSQGDFQQRSQQGYSSQQMSRSQANGRHLDQGHSNQRSYSQGHGSTAGYTSQGHGSTAVETGQGQSVHQQPAESSGSDDDLVLETFYHQDGTSYTCIYQAGQRYYLDTERTQDWVAFPEVWYREGVLVTDKTRSSQQAAGAQTPAGGSAVVSTVGGVRESPSSQSDDRAGFINHPTRGRLSTYIFEEKRNVHYYYDRESGCWVRLPVSWELHSDSIQRLLNPIQEAIPTWKDQRDMLASLRVCNYDPYDTVATFYTVNDQGDLHSARDPGDAKLIKKKEEHIKKLTAEIRSLRRDVEEAHRKIAQSHEEKIHAQNKVESLEEQVTSLEVRVATGAAQLGAVQRERPRTAGRRVSVAQPTPVVVEEEGPSVEPATVQAISAATKGLHQQQLRLKQDTQRSLGDVSALVTQLAAYVKKIAQFDTSSARELVEMKELYQREALQRKLLYNKLQELRGNIRVFARCRYDNRVPCALDFPSTQEVKVPDGRKGFKFDRVYSPHSTQDEIFDETRAIITSCVDGYHVCILAYGQTGSGKTYTMTGSEQEPGVNVRSITELLKICKDRDNVDYELKASMVEIYNESIQDLLSTKTPVLDLRSHGNQVQLPGLTEMAVRELVDIEVILELGEQNRTVAATKMNSHSSRSHLLFMITVEGKDKASGATSRGILTLCDLAGSERVSKTEAQGQRLIEAASINKSLSALGQVFTALRTGQLHVPYRNSKLTHLLQPSLSGDAKACLFVTVSPDQNNIPETISTLQFGSNARQVALGQAKKHVTNG